MAPPVAAIGRLRRKTAAKAATLAPAAINSETMAADNGLGCNAKSALLGVDQWAVTGAG
jgi:hypothetical protein